MNNKPVIKKSSLIDAIIEKVDPMQSKRTQLRMSIAASIIEAMKAQKISKKQLAEKCNKSPAMVTKWLSGTQNFTLDALSDLEYILGIQLITISTEENNAKIVKLSKTKKENSYPLASEPEMGYSTSK